MKPVQDGGVEVAQWGVAMGKQGGGGCSASLGEKKTFSACLYGGTLLVSLDR